MTQIPITDDEAFVRAIVAAPADDAPRLVYADWLDERGDQRGAYVRAEIEWAEPWTRGQIPALTGRLLVLAGWLDPVWVARVSRPPAGVCSTHIQLSDCGPPVSEVDIAGFERRHGVDLPSQYRAFLLNCNGGRVDGSQYGFDGQKADSVDFIFYSLGTGDGRGLDSWVSQRATFFDSEWAPSLNGEPGHARAYFLQFIDVGCNPDLIYGIQLGVTGPVHGNLQYFDYSVGFWPGYPTGASLVAGSFASFLAKLPIVS